MKWVSKLNGWISAWGINAAVYRLQQSNLAGRDPADPDYSVAIGKIHSHGFEFDGSGQISNRLGLLANYSWIEAEFGGGRLYRAIASGARQNIAAVHGQCMNRHWRYPASCG